jgi:PS-10 peptidase S37
MKHLAFAVLVLSAACSPDETPSESFEEVRAADVATELENIPGMTVESESTSGSFRVFVLTYRQPVHHWDDSQGTFEQRLTLLYKSQTAPTVLVSTGYGISTSPSRSEPTRLLEGNQVTVEHRFFTPSRPSPASWKRLNVQQAAADHHRIVVALKKKLLRGPWVSTGASKGGMTSVYHRRFYPKDVVATVAYVAPHDVDDAVDAHSAFLANVGPSAACRADLTRFQRETLSHRDEIVDDLEAYERSNGVSFVNGAEHAFETMVIDTPFVFWQYGGASGCASIPRAGASAGALLDFLDETVGLYQYTHADADSYIPFYYQAATQLGYPTLDTSALADLLRLPDTQAPKSYVPADIEVVYRGLAMKDIDDWMKDKAERIMLIYGEYDPWSAEQFTFGAGTRDSWRYIVPAGNHGATISQLPTAQRNDATAKLRAWCGLSRQPDERAIAPGELDAVDPLLVHRPRL